MIGRFFGNPVLNRANQKDQVREGGYFSIPLQREYLGAENFHETYRELGLVVLALALIALLVFAGAALVGADTVRDISAGVAVGFWLAFFYLMWDRMQIARRIALDIHNDRDDEREAFRQTENMYSVALAHYLQYKEGQPFEIEKLRLFAKYQEMLQAGDVAGFNYNKGDK